MDVLGIDISKDDFHACLLQGGRQHAHSFPNKVSGYRQLSRWLNNRKTAEVHACMEATGPYWRGLANALFASGLRVSVVNPARTAWFARSQLRRTKTDAVDAQMIAQFCQTQQPGLWTPPAPKILELRGLLSYRQELVEQKTRIGQIAGSIEVSRQLHRLHTRHLEVLNETIAVVEGQLRETLKAHPELSAQVETLQPVEGLGFLTATAIVAKLPVDRLRDGKAAAAYVGLTPKDRQSGTSVKGQPHICKTGDGTLRRDLYMPALAAIRCNPILAVFAARLRERGKPQKVIIVAVMRKLIVLAFNLLKERHAAPIAVTA